MSINRIQLDEANSKEARDLLDALRKLRNNFSILEEHLLAMGQMVDSGASGDDVNARIAETYAVEGADDATRKANATTLFSEINSTVGNSAALVQLCAKVGTKTGTPLAGA